MGKAYRVFPLDTDLINKGIDKGNESSEGMRGRITQTIETLTSRGFEAAKGPDTEKGYPSEILVGGANDQRVREGFKRAVQGSGLSDYILPSGKTYTR